MYAQVVAAVVEMDAVSSHCDVWLSVVLEMQDIQAAELQHAEIQEAATAQQRQQEHDLRQAAAAQQEKEVLDAAVSAAEQRLMMLQQQAQVRLAKGLLTVLLADELLLVRTICIWQQQVLRHWPSQRLCP